MRIEIHMVEGAIDLVAQAWDAEGAGAVVCFKGMVRDWEQGKAGRIAIAGLHYEVYEGMARRQLKRLAEEALEKYRLLMIKVVHSRGFVSAGKCSFCLHMAGVHREETLAAMEWFIDAMKQDVPIWKQAVAGDVVLVEEVQGGRA